MVYYRSRRETFFMLLFSIDIVTDKVCSLNDTGLEQEFTFYQQEARLRETILPNYSNLIRPSKLVNISVSLHILRLNELDIHRQFMETSGWLELRWNDPRLTWDPQLFGGIQEIFDSELVLWRPEIVVDNTVKQITVLGDKTMYLRADYRGNVLWEPPNIFQTHCDVAVTYFPFDTQICLLEVGTWGLTDEEVDLVPYMSEVYFYLQVKRRPVHYVLTILIPVVITSLMASAVFLVPTSSGAKIQFSLTILLTYTVTLSIVSAYMPSSSSTISVLSVYLTIILVTGVQVTFLVVLIVNLYNRPPESPIPGWIRYVIGSCMLRILSCKLPRCCGSKPTPPQQDMSASNSADPAPQVDEIKIDDEKQESLGTSPLNTTLATPSVLTSASVENSVNGWSKGLKWGDNVGESEDPINALTWIECSEIMNKFCLTFMTPFVILVTMTGLAALFFGSYSVVDPEWRPYRHAHFED